MLRLDRWINPMFNVKLYTTTLSALLFPRIVLPATAQWTNESQSLSNSSIIKYLFVGCFVYFYILEKTENCFPRMICVVGGKIRRRKKLIIIDKIQYFSCSNDNHIFNWLKSNTVCWFIYQNSVQIVTQR